MRPLNLLRYGFAFALSILIVNIAYGVYSRKKLPEQLSFGFEVKPWYKYHKDGQPGREIFLYFDKNKPVDSLAVSVSCEGKKNEYTVRFPGQSINGMFILLPPNTGIKATKATITLTNPKQSFSETIPVPEKKQWKVYIYPHSHVDIGYTNLQQVVEKLHIRNIDVGIDIADKTKAYPPGARFVWNPESTWVVDQYLKQASPAQQATFVAAVKKGWIQVDAAYANINTSTCSDEELLRMFKSAKDIEALTQVPVQTMVQMDNPGAAWGMVQAAAANGIKGFFSFPNYFDLRHRWENRPFYWQGQDGSKIFYLQATSYGYGFKAKGRIYGLGKIQAFTPAYDRLSTNDPTANFIDPFIFEETARLERSRSPYDIFAMTWSMADNCLIDADLPEAVRLWNQRYAYPKLIISGTKEILEAYEKAYQDIIPTYSGDISEFWTQGLGADAKSVGIGRKGKEDLVQAEALWAMLRPTDPFPTKKVDSAWDNALLSAEHTWGFQDPNAPMAKEVEATKAGYFRATAHQASELINEALDPIERKGKNGFAVINTLSWPRDGIITLSAAQSLKGNVVVDENNNEVLSQRLSSGELVFEAKGIPGLGSKYFRLLPGNAKSQPLMLDGTTLSNQFITVTVDGQTGNIKNLIDRKSGRDLVDHGSKFGFNSYNYLEGVRNGSNRTPLGAIKNADQVAVRVKENGPLVASLLVTAKAEGCNWLTREVKISRNQPELELINTVDKIGIRTKEGIHYGFPFEVPDGTIKMDIPFGVMSPEADQIPYSNKNWFTFQRWIDVSNQDYGVTWTSIESPIVELGDITGTILDGARQATEWIKKVEPTQTLLSWPVNNHWDTNFPLEQSGVIGINYFIRLHQGAFDPVTANAFGTGKHRPMLVVETTRNPIEKPIFRLDNPKIMLSMLKKSDDGRALIARFRSLSAQPEKFGLTFAKAPSTVYSCTPNEQIVAKQGSTISMLPFGNNTFRIEL